jgi:hypothetical protein
MAELAEPGQTITVRPWGMALGALVAIALKSGAGPGKTRILAAGIRSAKAGIS